MTTPDARVVMTPRARRMARHRRCVHENGMMTLTPWPPLLTRGLPPAQATSLASRRSFRDGWAITFWLARRFEILLRQLWVSASPAPEARMQKAKHDIIKRYDDDDVKKRLCDYAAGFERAFLSASPLPNGRHAVSTLVGRRGHKGSPPRCAAGSSSRRRRSPLVVVAAIAIHASRSACTIARSTLAQMACRRSSYFCRRHALPRAALATSARNTTFMSMTTPPTGAARLRLPSNAAQKKR